MCPPARMSLAVLRLFGNVLCIIVVSSSAAQITAARVAHATAYQHFAVRYTTRQGSATAAGEEN